LLSEVAAHAERKKVKTEDYPVDEGSILNKVRETYLGFSSYSDSGTVKIVPPIGKGKATEFKTYFVRPDKVRFEWNSWHPFQGDLDSPMKSAIWSDGERSNILFMGDQKGTDGISLAIAGATGVSSGSVHMILKLLFPEGIQITGVWHEMQNVKLLDDEEIGGSCCYHLIGETKRPDDTEAWISKNNLVVRRLRVHRRLTPEDRGRMNAKRIEGLQKAGVPPEHFPKESLEVREYYQEYNYDQILTDIELSDQLFTALHV
jgi:hypothetical protein